MGGSAIYLLIFNGEILTSQSAEQDLHDYVGVT